MCTEQVDRLPAVCLKLGSAGLFARALCAREIIETVLVASSRAEAVRWVLL